jgi:hypothetical protein
MTRLSIGLRRAQNVTQITVRSQFGHFSTSGAPATMVGILSWTGPFAPRAVPPRPICRSLWRGPLVATRFEAVWP